MTAAPPQTIERIGVVVHPSRVIDTPLGALSHWVDRNGVELVQIPVPGQDRRVAEAGEPTGCDLIVSIGGDGTMLAAIRAAAGAGRPALGVSCGSLGVLTTVDTSDLSDVLDRFGRGDWSPRRLPALSVSADGREEMFALNDVVVVRGGIGQIRVTTKVDGVLFNRLAGDGCIVSTPLGSSAYSLAAGSALLTPETEAFLITPLPTHGGSRQPLVVDARSRLELEIGCGIGGARLEIDGQRAGGSPESLSVGFRREVATLVSFPEQESLFTSLRRRRIIVDSPRLLAEDAAE
jgi:NAD+ kinase